MKKKRTKTAILMTVLLLILFSLPAYGKESAKKEEGLLAPYFYVEGADPFTDSFPLKSTQADVTINGVIAETYVTQTYANEGSTVLNASYVFPASTGVTIHGMTMTIGDEIITAQIRERKEAKEEFVQAQSEGKTASLLEQQRPNVFTMDVANILPGDTVCIKLHYTQLLTASEGVYQFVFPTVVGPRYVGAPKTVSGNQSGQEQSSVSGNTLLQSDDSNWAATPYLQEGTTASGSYNIQVRLSTGVPITELTSSSHEIFIEQPLESEALITLAHPEEFAGDRDFILEYRLTGEEISSGLLLYRSETENFFLLTIQPPKRCEPESVPPREYLFVLDVSGSMHGYPLDTAKDLITDLVSNLRETDSFNLILFSDDTQVMAPESVAATQKNIKQAVDLIDLQKGGGGTELVPALEAAAAIPQQEGCSRSIVVITDGFLYHEKEIFAVIHDNLETTDFFSFGIGTSVNRYLIEGIARAGSGEAFIVTEPDQAAETAERFRTYIQSPVLTDVRIAYDGFDVYDTEPAFLPTLFAEKPIVLFGKWRGEPDGTIRLAGKTGNGDYTCELSVSEISASSDNSAIAYLWARTHLERITDYGFSEDDPQIKEEVTAIGLKYSMMTPYTSFIAVSDTVRNPDQSSTDVSQPLPLPSHVSGLAVGSYTVGSEPEEFLLAGMLLITAGGFLFRRRKHSLRHTGQLS